MFKAAKELLPDSVGKPVGSLRKPRKFNVIWFQFFQLPVLFNKVCKDKMNVRKKKAFGRIT